MPAHVLTRVERDGKWRAPRDDDPTGIPTRFIVRFRSGGRGTTLRHAGSFRTLPEAEARRDWINAELAAGREPRLPGDAS